MAEDSCYPRKQRQRKHGCKHGSFQNGKNKLLKGWGVRSKKANEEMALYNLTMKVNRLELLKANIGLEMIAGTDELDKYMAEILQGRTEDELKRMGGILGKSVKANSKKAAAIPNASFHNATFSDRIWMYQDLLKADLSKLLQTGLIQGKNPRVLARELKKAFDTTTYNAERLMRTELARVQTEAQKQSFQRNGFSLYEYIANINCCDICQCMNGKHLKVESMMPGENAPPMHPHCRCSTAAWEDSEEYNAWVDYLASGGTTEEWNKLKDGGFLELRQTTKITKKKGDKIYSSVDAGLVNSKKYHDKFEGITTHKAVNEAIYQHAMRILEHRDGTPYEDMVIIDSRTGKFITENTNSTNEGKTGLTDNQYAAVSAHNGDIIIIHNHPNSSRVSYADILTMYNHRNVSSIVAVGHDGSVQIVYNLNRDFYIDKLWGKVYNEALEKYQDKELSEKIATSFLYESGMFDFESR